MAPDGVMITLTIASAGDTTDPVYAEAGSVFELRNEGAAALDGSLGIQTWSGVEAEPPSTATWTWLRNPDGSGGYTAGDIYGVDTVAAESSYPLTAELSVSQWIRFKSHDGSGGTQVQSAARTLKLFKKKL